MVTNPDAGHDEGAHANVAVSADISVRMEKTSRVMRQNDRIAFDARPVTDMNAVRIGQVDVGPQRNFCISADIISDQVAPAPRM